jgi:hypothetical protein
MEPLDPRLRRDRELILWVRGTRPPSGRLRRCSDTRSIWPRNSISACSN